MALCTCEKGSNSEQNLRPCRSGLKAGRWFCSLLGAAALLSGCGKPTEPAPGPSPTPAPQSPSTNAAPAAASKPEFDKLLGKWQRPDGDYMLEFKGVDAEGKLDVGYFNPSPINVSRAVAARDSEGTKVLIELNDDNYPGCLYRLQYDPKVDQLFGTYYQAALDQTYNVTFGRFKAETP